MKKCKRFYPRMKTAGIKIVVFMWWCALSQGEDSGTTSTKQQDLSTLRRQAIEKLRNEQHQTEHTSEYFKAQQKLAAEREKTLVVIRESPLQIQARVLSVNDRSILAFIRIKKKLPLRSGENKQRISLSNELDEPVWIEGVDTSDIVDNDVLQLTVYLAGKQSYPAVSGA